MRISVKLHGTLRSHHPGPDPHRAFDVEIGTGSLISDLIPTLDLPDGLVWVVSVNGKAAELDHLLSRDDKVSLFPPAAGG